MNIDFTDILTAAAKWRLPILIVLALGCLQVPFSSFMADDFIILGMLENVSPLPGTAPFHLYTMSDGNADTMQLAKEAGAFPWFFQSHFKLNFFRPLSSLLLTLDYHLFGLEPYGYGIHSILWLLVLVWGVWRLLKKFLPAHTAVFAASIYAMSAIMGIAVFWAACRHNLVAPALALWAFLAHLHWQKTGRRLFLLLSLAGFSLAFLAGETAIAVLAYPLCYALFANNIDRRKRFIALAPLLILVILYLVFYSYYNFGASKGSNYENPLAKPGAFLIQLLPRLLEMTSGFLLGGTIDAVVMDPHGRSILIGAGILTTIMLTFMLRLLTSVLSREERNTVLWLGFGALASCLPMAASMTVSFHLPVPFIGTSALIALLILHRSLIREQNFGIQYQLYAACCILLILFHLLVAPLLRIATPYFTKQMFTARLDTTMKQLNHDFPELAKHNVYILHAPDLVIGFHSYFYLLLYQFTMPATWRVFSWQPESPELRRTSESSLEITFPGKGIPRSGFYNEEKIHLSDIIISITEADTNTIRTITCTFNQSLNSPSLVFLAWNHNRLTPVQLP